MKNILIFKDWENPYLLRQTPGSIGYWGDFKFSLAPPEKTLRDFDYAIILNKPNQKCILECNPDHVWALMQEPPNEYFGPRQKAESYYSRIYTTNSNLIGNKYFHSQPALPWHIDLDYDRLKLSRVPAKEKKVSWITSNISVFEGHKNRLIFLSKLNNSLGFDLYGRGYKYIKNKWDGLAPYSYSIVVENYCNPFYWSEKLADCFLTWTFPIYYGCTKIFDFFPKESLVNIDINDVNALEIVQATINSDLWKKNFEAINYARELILDRYQFFPFIFNEINKFESSNEDRYKIRSIKLNHDYSYKEMKLIKLLSNTRFVQKIKRMMNKIFGNVFQFPNN